MAELEHWNRPGKGAAWNFVKLGGKQLPGVARVKVKSQLAKLDTKKAKGKTKAKQTNEGPDNAKVSIRLQLEADEDLELLKQNFPILRPSQERKPSEPLSFEHPLAGPTGVAMIVLESVDWDHPDAVDGWIIAIEASEWVQKPKESGGLGKGKGGGAKTCAQKAAEAQAAWEDFAGTQAQIEQLEAKKASGQLLKSTEFAKLEQLKRRATQEHNIFLAASASADNCKAAKPPSQSAKSNVI